MQPMENILNCDIYLMFVFVKFIWMIRSIRVMSQGVSLKIADISETKWSQWTHRQIFGLLS